MKPIIKKKVLLEKVPGKGGWTYALLPKIMGDKKKPFGFKKVRGTIDGFEIRQYHLMPMKNGQLFLPVRAEIRKKIGKEAGDYVMVILYPDDTPIEIPQEFVLCLKDESKAWKNFQNFPESEQKKYIQWIYAVKNEELKIERMAQAINQILEGKTL